MSKGMTKFFVLATLPVFLLLGYRWSGLSGVGIGFVGWLLFRVWFNKTFYPETPAWERPVSPQTLSMQETAKRKAEQKSKLQAANSTVHGRARWADVATDCPQLLVNRSADYDDGIFLGFLAEPIAAPDNRWSGANIRQALTYRGNAHGLTIAPTRSGKGATSIIPTLLTNNESAFVLDIKGENWFVTSPHRAMRGHRVIVINPFNQFGEELGFAKPMTQRFNPLNNIKSDSKTFDSDIMKVIDAIIIKESGNNSHFSDRARDLLAVLIGFVCSDPDELASGDNNLVRVREILKYGDPTFLKIMFRAMESPVSLVRNAGSFTNLDSNEVRDSRSTANTQTSFLDNQQIAYFLTGHNFEFSELRKSATTIYCIMDLDALQNFPRFARLMVQCLFSELYKKPAYSDRQVLVILDEQRQLQGMSVLEKSPSLLAGYKVRLWSIFQNIPEMEELYGKTWKTFIANAGFIQLIGSQPDTTTAEEFSKKIGRETVWQVNRSKSVQKGSHTTQFFYVNNVTGINDSEGEQFIGVDFLSLQDLASAPEDRGLVLLRGLDFPIMTWMLPYYQESSDQTFLEAIYAPHPDHNMDAYQWMKDFMQQAAQIN
jgi:type IV secretion system protein VirD4